MLGNEEKPAAPAYMYSTAAEKIESTRLSGHNRLHNPYTIQFLKPHTAGRQKILELGCGSGDLASEVMNIAEPTASCTIVDRDPAQVKLATQSLLAYSSRARVIQLDVVTELDKLREYGPFDLIYCRWLLVHLPKALLGTVLRNIIGLLSTTGIFICDECDNRTVEFRPIATLQATAPFQEATKLWLDLSQALMRELGNDLELTAEKIQHLLTEASNKKGQVNIEGQYQVTLRTQQEKSLIPDGYRSSSATIFRAVKKPIEDIIAPFEQCAKDNAIEVPFLTQHVVRYSKI